MQTAFEEIAQQRTEALSLTDPIQKVECFADALRGDIKRQQAFVSCSFVSHIPVAQNCRGSSLLK